MTTFLIIATTVVSLYGLENNWFDTRMHYYKNTYQSSKACDHASIQLEKSIGRVCVPKADHSGHVDLYTTNKNK